MNLYYLHGMESSPDGFRANYLRETFPDIIVPALTPDVQERQRVLEQEIAGPAVLIGSSLGGLSALDYAMRHPDDVRAMVLLAPAVGFYREEWRTPERLAFVNSMIIPAHIPTTVIAATGDEVIPLDSIRNLVERSPNKSVEIIEVEDTHRMRSSEALDHMIRAAKRLITLAATDRKV